MNANDVAEAEESRNLRRFRLYDRLWHDTHSAQREADATARLDFALRRCCPDIDRTVDVWHDERSGESIRITHLGRPIGPTGV